MSAFLIVTTNLLHIATGILRASAERKNKRFRVLDDKFQTEQREPERIV